MAWPCLLSAQGNTVETQSNLESLDLKLDKLEQSLEATEIMVNLKTQEMRNDLKEEFRTLEDEQNSTGLKLILSIFAVLTGLGFSAIYFRGELRKLKRVTLPQKILEQEEKINQQLSTFENQFTQRLAKEKEELNLRLDDELGLTQIQVDKRLAKAEKDLSEQGQQKLEDIAGNRFEILFREKRDSLKKMIDFHEIDAHLIKKSKVLMVYQDGEPESEDISAEGLGLLRDTFRFGHVIPHPISQRLTYKDLEEYKLVVFYDIYRNIPPESMGKVLRIVLKKFTKKELMEPSFSFMVYTKRSDLQFLYDYRSISNAANSKFTFYARIMESLRYHFLVKNPLNN